jgi:hypothetical protein
MIFLRTLLRIFEKISNQKSLKNIKFFGCPKLPTSKKNSIFGAELLNQRLESCKN